MKKLHWFKQISNKSSSSSNNNNNKGNNSRRTGRTLSFGEYRRAISWSKYLVSNGAEIKGEGEQGWSADMSQLFIGNKFASACKKPPVFCIITEYLAGGSLKKYLHHQQPYSLPLSLVLKLALDIAHGMQYLHSQGILHRDLKSENLLLDQDMSVKVADFGISCLESQCGSAKGFTGTYRWMAPEMIKEKHHTKKVDVYSFGIVLWELLTALTPFDNMTPEQAAFAVCQKNARPPLPVSCPRAFSQLIKRCWSSNPVKRPHFDEIVTLLESYSEAMSEDADFLSKYKPGNEYNNPLGRIANCIVAYPSCAFSKASSSSSPSFSS
ncbi:Serine/threonine/tyrosine-protein kinase HT1 [Linum perenne]